MRNDPLPTPEVRFTETPSSGEISSDQVNPSVAVTVTVLEAASVSLKVKVSGDRVN